MARAEAYYFQKLGKIEQSVYHAMYEGLKEIRPSFPVPRIDPKTMAEIYFMIRMDHPEIFYSVRYKFRFYANADTVELTPEYLFDKKNIKMHQQAMKSRVEKLVRPAKDMTDLEKELYVHDFICKNVRYDKLKKEYSHEIIGPLGQGVGVCEGIAKTVKILCDELGLWCIVALCDNNPEKKIKYRHTWNIIKLGGSYYHLDATFDNSLNKAEEIRYDYFNIDDGQVYRDHEPVIYKVPACTDHDHFYYKEKKLSFTKMEDVRKRIQQAAKKGKMFTFHWRGGYLTREVLRELLNMMEEEAAAKNKHAKVSLNWPQAVMRVSFDAVDKQEEMLLEEANEGEVEE